VLGNQAINYFIHNVMNEIFSFLVLTRNFFVAPDVGRPEGPFKAKATIFQY
jgi:hypothetical protein